MPWKDEREPTIKLCMGRQVDLVQKFIFLKADNDARGDRDAFKSITEVGNNFVIVNHVFSHDFLMAHLSPHGTLIRS